MLSREEYIEELEMAKQKSELERRKPRYKCPKCGGGMCYDPTNLLGNVVLACYPPIHRTAYKCDTCGFEECIDS